MNSAAAQEMLLAWVAKYNSTPQAPAPARSTFLANLQNIGGFPAKCHKIGVANGSGAGAADPTPAGKETMAVAGTCLECDLYSAPGVDENWAYPNLLGYAEIGVEGSGLTWAGNQKTQFDSAPGGTSDFFNQIELGFQQQGYEPTLDFPGACFIPTISALAMAQLSPYANADLQRNLTQNPPASQLDEYISSTKQIIPTLR